MLAAKDGLDVESRLASNVKADTQTRRLRIHGNVGPAVAQGGSAEPCGSRESGTKDATQPPQARIHERALMRNSSTIARMSAATKTKVWYLPALGTFYQY
jgi:hypothetical protein